MVSVSVSRAEDVAEALEALAQLLVVLDDAVVHHGQFFPGEVRVGIALARRAVGGPAGVGDTQVTGQWLGCQGLLQLGDLADTATALQRTGLGEDRHAGAVIAPVLQALEAFDQDRGDVAFGDGANDATHRGSPQEAAARISWTPRARICSATWLSRRSSVIRVWTLLQGSSRLGIRRPTLSPRP